MTSAADRHIGQHITVALGFIGAMVVPLLAAARDPAPNVPVEVTACGEDIPPLVRERLAVEVEVLWRESSNPPEMASLRVTIRCEGDVARVEVGATSEVSRSSVDLSGVDREARARLLALKATELIHLVGEKTWQKGAASKGDGGASTSVSTDDAGKSAQTDPPASPASSTGTDASAGALELNASSSSADQSPRSKSPHTSGHSSISAGGFALFAGRPLAHVVGPSLSGTLSLLPRFSVGAEVDGNFGSLQQSDRLLRLRGGAGSATLLFVGNLGAAWWGIGAGGRVGYWQLSGDPGPRANVVGKTSSGVWGGPLVVADVSYPLGSSRSFIELGAEGGLVTLPIGALIDQSERFYTLDGPWLGLRASLGLDLGSR